MKKWKMIVCFCIAALTLAGCQTEQQTDLNTEELPTIEIFTYKNTDIEIPDSQMVVDRINEYIAPLIQAQIHVTFIPQSSYRSRLNQVLDSREQLDLFLLSSGMKELYEDGRVAVLNELIRQYAPEIVTTVGEEYMQGAYDVKTGEYYAVPTCRDYSLRPGLEYRSDIAEKYGLDMENVRTVSDLSEVFASLKEQAPMIYPMAPNGIYKNWDNLGDGLGVLMYDRMDTTVVNLYETEEYREYLSLIRDWNQKGYLYDTSRNSGSNAYYLSSGFVFSCFANGKPGFVVQEIRNLNCPIGFLPLEEDSISTDRIAGWMWGIPQDSQYKEETMQFLNLLYHDKTVVDLWTYGIEGIHYDILDEEQDIIGFPEGVDASSSGFPIFLEYTSGNQYLAHIWEGNPPTIWEEMKSFNDNAVRSKAFGFQYDDSEVRSEVIACSTVVQKYEEGFLHGIYDIDAMLPVLIGELREAGIERIIEEKQRQLDEWLEAK